jgi:CheY-like chemotaxis protein
LTRQLQQAGFQTEVANHGRECLDILDRSLGEDRSFDIILMDIEMPVMGGIATAAELRKWEVAGKLPAHIPVIAVTGNARREHIERGTSLLLVLTLASSVGIDYFVVKPYEKQELIKKIHELTGKTRK